MYDQITEKRIDLNFTSQDLEVDVPLLTAGNAEAKYQCLVWDEPAQSWSTLVCSQKVATTSIVTCKCSKFG